MFRGFSPHPEQAGTDHHVFQRTRTVWLQNVTVCLRALLGDPRPPPPPPSVDWSLNLPSVASEVREGMAWAAFSWPRSPSPGLHAASCPQAREGCWRCHGRAGKLGGLWGRGAVGRPGGLPSACGSPGGWAASSGVELCWRLNGARFARKGGLCPVKDAFIPTGLPLCYESCEYSLEHLPFS